MTKIRLLKVILLLIVCSSWQFLAAQAPYTDPIYSVSVQKDIVYGTAIDFAGREFTLKMDVYKPLNNDANRPVYIHAHGGGWQEISVKEQPEGAAVCVQMAKRGYVAANIEYRRGFHRVNFYQPYALCGSTLLSNGGECIYAQDTTEVIRAVYRGMQDFKGAIRYMKTRHLMDSTRTDMVFIGGESAGGFLANYTGFLTCPEEKPLSCYAQSDALTTDSDLSFCMGNNVSVSRPDLGSIEGELYLNLGYDAQVKGVANFFGGVFHMIQNGPNPPALYLFHQTSDVVVDCNYKMPYQSLYDQVVYPFNLCQPLVTIPWAWGSCSIRDLLQSQPVGSFLFRAEIVNDGPPFALADPPGHAYDNINLRSEQVAEFFSPLIDGQLQLPQGASCTVSGVGNPSENQTQADVFPNPASGEVWLSLTVPKSETGVLEIFDQTGKKVAEKEITAQSGYQEVLLPEVNVPGIYFWTFRIGLETVSGKLIRQ